MKRIISSVAAFASLVSALSFTQTPILSKDNAGKYWVEFTLNEARDVAVSIVDPRDSVVIRHLVAGVLGANPPAPLLPNTLHQKFEWDGKDDMDFAVTNPEQMAVRVRAGLSVKPLTYVGNNPYSFSRGLASKGGGIGGLGQASDGSVIVYGGTGGIYNAHTNSYIKNARLFNADAVYQKTIFPPPANLPLDKVQGWEMAAYPDANSYTPRYLISSNPGFTKTILSGQGNQQLLYISNQNEVIFGTVSYKQKVLIDGSKPIVEPINALLLNPTPPGMYCTALGIRTISPNEFGGIGNESVTQIPNSNDVLVSGIYEKLSNGTPVATGFYRDGRIFRVNTQTGSVTVWLDQDTVVMSNRQTVLQGTNFPAISGTAVDAKMRVYVCDRLNRRIAVYDSTAQFLGSMAVDGPEGIAVGKKTGTVYVVSRYGVSPSGTIKLTKFAPFDNGGALASSLVIGSTVNFAEDFGTRSYIVANDSVSPARVWVASTSLSVKIYSDLGSSFVIYKDFDDAIAKNQTQGFDRIAVDRQTETVYFNDSWYGIYKIDNWANPVLRACSTTTRARLQAVDFAISPHNQLYVRDGSSTFYGPIKRYSLGSLHAPVNWSNTNNNMLTPLITGHYGANVADRGLAVNKEGVVAVMADSGANTGNWKHSLRFFADSGSNSYLYGKVKVFPLSDAQNGGVKFDLKGNVYVGAITASSHQAPAAYASDWTYTNAVGTIVRFPAGFDSASITKTAVTGSSAKIYSMGMAPFSRQDLNPLTKGVSSVACQCRSPRFDVDPYGRLFVPNALLSQIVVSDNEDNAIVRFGRYGNIDAVPNDNYVPLAFPTGVAASEDFIYVADYGNSRIARLKMEYELDNHPEITKPTKAEIIENVTSLSLSVSPNPFNPSGAVSFNLASKGRVRLDVFSVNGQFVTTLVSDILSAGKHNFKWNGKNMRGSDMASGRYVMRLVVGTKVVNSLVVLAR